MKAKYILILMLLSVMIGYNTLLSQNNNPVTTDLSMDNNEANAPIAEEQQATLYQNDPDPFTQSAQIKYYLPETVGKALLCFYDLKGQELKQIVLTQRGYGSETVFASEFAAGNSYFYALIINGDRVDMKRMTVAEGIRPVSTELSTDSKRSKNLIDRFNAFRTSEGLQSIQHDTVLDNISKMLLTDETKIYRKTAGVYDEESVRLLFREKGILDYQYEIMELSDKDTAAVFKNFLLVDKWNHIRTGYYRIKDRHILVKTKSYLKYDHARWHERSGDPDPLNPSVITTFYTDWIIYHFKILTPDQYYYQFYEHIPLSSEKGDNMEKKKIQMTPGISMFGGEYDFVIKSSGMETDMFLVISNKNNQRVAVIK